MDIGQLTIPLFVGTLLNWSLLGVLIVQVYLYFLAFPKDQRANKLVVVFVIIAETLQTFGDTRNTIRTFGAGWGNPAMLDEVGWAWFSVPVLGSTIGCVGQMFFAWRIYVIGGGTLVIPIVIGTITLFQWGAGIWTGVQISNAGRFSLLTFKSMKPPVAWLSATALADLIIVAGTVYYLLRARQPGFRGATHAAVNRIIKVTIETGIPCAVFAIIDLALFVKYNGNNYHLGTCIWISKVYSNSIMAILNSRMQIGHDAIFQASVNMSDMVFQSRVAGGAATSHVTVQLATSQESVSDHDDDSSRHPQALNFKSSLGELPV
ncbi:hypothetical protein GGX14DRAFT_514511 [Mycena pura]|uniref:DUF6534 domain-containing protein n=1 Tax=Mycena pura TaxID=153505 RepID=A0AAD6YHC4_9AGAR|nr:hypothetical protein GGX14DRAFT_514511 [Mycena pura]